MQDMKKIAEGIERGFISSLKGFLNTEPDSPIAQELLQELCNSIEYLGRYPYLIEPSWTNCKSFDGVIPLPGLHERWSNRVSIQAMLWTIDQACMPLQFEAQVEETQNLIQLNIAFGDANVIEGTCQSEKEIYRCFTRNGGPSSWRYEKTWVLQIPAEEEVN